MKSRRTHKVCVKARACVALQNFDRYRCCRLVLDCLCQYDDPTIAQMSIAICGILAAKVNSHCQHYRRGGLA